MKNSKIRVVNIFLPEIEYTQSRNSNKVKHHVFDLYTNVFDNFSKVRVFPIKKYSNIFNAVFPHYREIKAESVNVITQGYSVLSVFFAQIIKKDIISIIHTWNVPGFSEERLTSKIYAFFLKSVINNALLIVVASKKQKKQLEVAFPLTHSFFAPVTVDSNYWNPKNAKSEVLHRLDLNKNEYILTVGGNDRNELAGIALARELRMPYVRVSRSKPIISDLQLLKKTNNDVDIIILNAVDDESLISLYNHSYLVLLATITKTNPAGLSALVEAMSSESFVVVSESLSEGYLKHLESGFTYNVFSACEIANHIINIDNIQKDRIRKNAREVAINDLNHEKIGRKLLECIVNLSKIN